MTAMIAALFNILRISLLNLKLINIDKCQCGVKQVTKSIKLFLNYKGI
jgi:hypothetical protein